MTGIKRIGIAADPELIFGNRGTCIDQRTGISLYGPFSSSMSEGKEERKISLGVIGSKRTIDLLLGLLGKMAGPIPSIPSKTFMPSFPGLSTSTILNFSFNIDTSNFETITTKEIDLLKKKEDFHDKVEFVFDCLEEKLKNFSEREPRPEVVIIALPQEFEDECTKHWDRFGRPITRRRKMNRRKEFFDEYESLQEVIDDEAEEIHFSSIWRKIKTEGMRISIPTQIIRPNTLLGKGVEDECTIAWNLAVALCYKAGGHPWRLSNASPGTCYVGISFYESVSDYELKSSVAQIFSHKGEGLVLKGEKAEKGKEGREPRLSQKCAKKLLDEVIRTYARQERTLPSRIVIHKSSKYSNDEIEGFHSAMNNINQHDLLSIDKSYFRLLRAGQHPPIRGTYALTSDDKIHLYTKGYVPFMGKYWGPSTPRPLAITQQTGDTTHQQLCEEILGLTKMNWNSAAYCMREPITLSFSRVVGGLLSEAETHIDPVTRYAYYM